jgi:hypothetical protein
MLSRAWLGQNLLGNIRARGHALGNWEGWDVDVAARGGGPLMCCSANSYAGGWVSVGNDDVLVVNSASPEDKSKAPNWRVLALDDSDLPTARPRVAAANDEQPGKP